MRTLYFLVPGTGGRFACGGLWAELKTMQLAQQICHAEVVTYRQREKGTLFLDDVLRQPNLEQTVFVVSWGFDVPKLVKRLRSQQVIYHAHSAGYGFQIPSQIPILAVSRNTMGYWGQQAPHSLIYYLPNQISDEFQNEHRQRDIDVLVQTRKSSRYLLNQLVPALQPHCRLTVIDSYVDSLPLLFNRTKVYLYDSAEYWAQQGVTEGFGLQPLEAMACGCWVFSSVNHGLSDYLDPGFTSYKIAGYAKEYDVQRILAMVQHPAPCLLPEHVLAHHRAEALLQRLHVILQDINAFFDHQPQMQERIPDLTSMGLVQLRLHTLMAKLKKKLA